MFFTFPLRGSHVLTPLSCGYGVGGDRVSYDSNADAPLVAPPLSSAIPTPDSKLEQVPIWVEFVRIKDSLRAILLEHRP
jgi:hypothetical protein